MNASPENSQPLDSKETADKVLSLAEAKLKKELESGGIAAGAEFVAPYILDARNSVGPIKNKHAEITSLPEELQDQLIDAIADNVLDTSMWDTIVKKFKKLLPGGFIYISYTEIKDGTMAGLLLTGMIGNERMQERLAKRAQPGFVEKVVKGVLPWIIKLDMEPDTKALLIILHKTLQVKGFTLESLAILRQAVRNIEATTAQVDAERDRTEIDSMSALLPVGDKRKTPEEMNLDDATGKSVK